MQRRPEGRAAPDTMLVHVPTDSSKQFVWFVSARTVSSREPSSSPAVSQTTFQHLMKRPDWSKQTKRDQTIEPLWCFGTRTKPGGVFLEKHQDSQSSNKMFLEQLHVDVEALLFKRLKSEKLQVVLQQREQKHRCREETFWWLHYWSKHLIQLFLQLACCHLISRQTALRKTHRHLRTGSDTTETLRALTETRRHNHRECLFTSRFLFADCDLMQVLCRAFITGSLQGFKHVSGCSDR